MENTVLKICNPSHSNWNYLRWTDTNSCAFTTVIDIADMKIKINKCSHVFDALHARAEQVVAKISKLLYNYTIIASDQYFREKLVMCVN